MSYQTKKANMGVWWRVTGSAMACQPQKVVSTHSWINKQVTMPRCGWGNHGSQPQVSGSYAYAYVRLVVSKAFPDDYIT